jgi:thiol-disulfide isomerase/thioredoxin
MKVTFLCVLIIAFLMFENIRLLRFYNKYYSKARELDRITALETAATNAALDAIDAATTIATIAESRSAGCVMAAATAASTGPMAAATATATKQFHLFHSEHCGHCRNMMPEWLRLEDKYKNENRIRIVKTECSTGLCDDIDITGYPTMRMMVGNKAIAEYNGPRTLEAMSQFVDGYLS